MKYKVAVSDDFFDAIVALPKSKQSKALEFVSKFRSNPLAPGINYEKLNSKYDQKLYSARVDDAYRAIGVSLRYVRYSVEYGIKAIYAKLFFDVGNALE